MCLGWRHGSLKWKITLWRREMEERWRKMGDGQKRWWQRSRDGSRRCLSKGKTLPWAHEEHAESAVEVKADLDCDRASSPMEKIEKEGLVGFDKAQIQKISPWHRLHIVVTYRMRVVRSFRRSLVEIEDNEMAHDLEKGSTSSSSPTIREFDVEQLSERTT